MISKQKQSNASQLWVPVFSLAFCVWEILLFRVNTASGLSVTGFLDDVLLVSATLLFLTLSRKLMGMYGLLLALLWLVLLGTATLANQLYFDTFHTWLSLDSLMHVEEVDDVSSSVGILMDNTTILLGIVLPLVLLLGVAWSWRKWETRGLTGWTVAVLITLALPPFFRSQGVATQENHFIPSALRLGIARSIHHMGPYSVDLALKGRTIEDLIPPMPGYRRGHNEDYPLLQNPQTQSGPSRRPNIILIEAESYRAAESGSYGAKLSMTPEFDKLAKEGLLASRFYASGIQTVRGELSLLCSNWPILGASAIYKRGPETDFTCIPDFLRREGWETYWFSAFKASYYKKNEFLKNHGFTHIHGSESHGKSEDKKLGWGLSDGEMGDRIIKYLDKAPQPFLATWITLSNHHPFNWDYPIEFPDHLPTPDEKDIYGAYKRGIYYTDHAIGQFVRRIRDRPWGKDAWIIIVGDHGMHIFPQDDKRTDMQKLEAHFRVPFLLIAPDVVEPGVVNRSASQTDLAPTLFELLEIKMPNAFVGQSIVRPASAAPSPILLVAENAASFIEDDTRCMVSRVTCYKNAQPQCARGEDPVGASHTCFRSDIDLLQLELPHIDRLPLEEAIAKREKLGQLLWLQTYLEGHDRLGGGPSWTALFNRD